MDMKEYLKANAQMVEDRLNELLPDAVVKPDAIHRAMRYSCLGGGKRLRAMLAMKHAQQSGKPGSRPRFCLCD